MATKSQRVLEGLQNNPNGLSAAQISARYRVGNPRAEVSRLRSNGVNIVTNNVVDSRGRSRTVYALQATHRRRRSA